MIVIQVASNPKTGDMSVSCNEPKLHPLMIAALLETAKLVQLGFAPAPPDPNRVLPAPADALNKLNGN